MVNVNLVDWTATKDGIKDVTVAYNLGNENKIQKIESGSSPAPTPEYGDPIPFYGWTHSSDTIFSLLLPTQEGEVVHAYTSDWSISYPGTFHPSDTGGYIVWDSDTEIYQRDTLADSNLYY